MVFATFQHEKKYWDKGFKAIVGIDEVGRGAWAGPLVVGAVIFPAKTALSFQVADSKLLSAKKRVDLVGRITDVAIATAIAEIPVSYINQYGIGKANMLGFRRVIDQLKGTLDFIFTDTFSIPKVAKKKQLAIISGDRVSATIAAASIVAKVYRDNLMTQIHDTFPAYRFDQHKGYGTKLHQSAIKQHGFCPIHRKSFDLSQWVKTDE